jgi:hypothetical protein
MGTCSCSTCTRAATGAASKGGASIGSWEWRIARSAAGQNPNQTVASSVAGCPARFPSAGSSWQSRLPSLRRAFRRAEHRFARCWNQSLTDASLVETFRLLGPSRTRLLRQCLETQLARASAETPDPPGSAHVALLCGPVADGRQRRKPEISRSSEPVSSLNSQTRSTPVDA